LSDLRCLNLDFSDQPKRINELIFLKIAFSYKRFLQNLRNWI
jgi:hypothetical protein